MHQTILYDNLRIIVSTHRINESSCIFVIREPCGCGLRPKHWSNMLERLMYMKKAFMALLMVCAVLATFALSAGGADAGIPSGPYLNAGQKAIVGSWEIQVTGGIKWTKEIKGDKPKSGEAQQQVSSKGGMVFALVPVSVKNVGDRTSSLLVAVWNLYDVYGKSYLMLTFGARVMPSSDYVSLADVKPGEARKGYLPFELPEGLDKKDKYIQIIVPLVGSATWKL